VHLEIVIEGALGETVFGSWLEIVFSINSRSRSEQVGRDD
jgi:hypothetical protein